MEESIIVKRLMNVKGIASEENKKGRMKFFLTDKPYNFKGIAEKFLGRKIRYIYQVKI